MSIWSQKGRVTQRDVARLLGISQSTVSLVLRRVEGHAVPVETVARIEAAARELGYVPNSMARALKTRRSMTIACVIPDIANPFYPPFVKGIQTVADGAGYDVITVNTDGLADREQRFLQWAMQGRADGIVGIFFTLKAPMFEPLLSAGVAVARVETQAKAVGPLPLDNIFVDNYSAARAVGRFLLARGHRHVGMISGVGGPQEARLAGFREAIAAAAGKIEVVLDDAFDEAGGYRAALQLIAREPRPTAIAAANDLLAIGALAACHEAGLAVARDIAVTGFDDIPAARLVTPALTTVSIFQDQIGRSAAATVLQRLGHEGFRAPSTSREMPYRLIKRAST